MAALKVIRSLVTSGRKREESHNNEMRFRLQGVHEAVAGLPTCFF